MPSPNLGFRTAERLTDHVRHVETKTRNGQQCGMRRRETSPADAVMFAICVKDSPNTATRPWQTGYSKEVGVLCGSASGNVKMFFIALCVFFN